MVSNVYMFCPYLDSSIDDVSKCAVVIAENWEWFLVLVIIVVIVVVTVIIVVLVLFSIFGNL